MLPFSLFLIFFSAPVFTWIFVQNNCPSKKAFRNLPHLPLVDFFLPKKFPASQKIWNSKLDPTEGCLSETLVWKCFPSPNGWAIEGRCPDPFGATFSPPFSLFFSLFWNCGNLNLSYIPAALEDQRKVAPFAPLSVTGPTLIYVVYFFPWLTFLYFYYAVKSLSQKVAFRRFFLFRLLAFAQANCNDNSKSFLQLYSPYWTQI